MSTQVRKVYIAGPMTGLPQFNIPAFDLMARQLRDVGFEVVSPAELDSPAVRAQALASPDGKIPADGKIAGETWGDMLARDVKIIADEVEGIVVLPGWQKSRGARLEVFTALLCGKPVYDVAAFSYEAPTDSGVLGTPTPHLFPIHKADAIFAIARSFVS